MVYTSIFLFDTNHPEVQQIHLCRRQLLLTNHPIIAIIWRVVSDRSHKTQLHMQLQLTAKMSNCTYTKNKNYQITEDLFAFLPCNAMLAWYMPSPCVCVSDTLRYCIKTAKRRITQIMPHDRAKTLVFWCQTAWQNSNWITPYGGDKCMWGKLKSTTFD